MKHVFPPLLCVPPESVEKFWPMAKPFIEDGYLTVDEFVPDDLLEWLSAGKGLLWVGVKEEKVAAALTTSIVRRPSGLVLRLHAAGGDLELMKLCEPILLEHARAAGCGKVIAEGRQGWLRALPGFRVVRLTIEKVL